MEQFVPSYPINFISICSNKMNIMHFLCFEEKNCTGLYKTITEVPSSFKLEMYIIGKLLGNWVIS